MIAVAAAAWEAGSLVRVGAGPGGHFAADRRPLREPATGTTIGRAVHARASVVDRPEAGGGGEQGGPRTTGSSGRRCTCRWSWRSCSPSRPYRWARSLKEPESSSPWQRGHSDTSARSWGTSARTGTTCPQPSAGPPCRRRCAGMATRGSCGQRPPARLQRAAQGAPWWRTSS
eukprot:COSAG01_NODE_874_length_12972_cov_15.914343_13_plen_173_part_00